MPSSPPPRIQIAPKETLGPVKQKVKQVLLEHDMTVTPIPPTDNAATGKWGGSLPETILNYKLMTLCFRQLKLKFSRHLCSFIGLHQSYWIKTK